MSLEFLSENKALIATFFFFQAEDGIRDHCVTGVQTCALPISAPRRARARSRTCAALSIARAPEVAELEERSEERRVGKECRSRWWQSEENSKTFWFTCLYRSLI